MRCISPVKNHSIDKLLQLYSETETGIFPVGANNFWHGGIHLPVTEAIVAATPGKLIAYRMSDDYLFITKNNKKYYYSDCFALLEHNYKSSQNVRFRFYSLYMHLLPSLRYTTNTIRPFYLTKIPYLVTKNTGLEVRNSMVETSPVTRTIPVNEIIYLAIINPKWAMVLDGEHPSVLTTEFVKFGNSVTELEPEPFIEAPGEIVTLDKPLEAGTLLGYPGIYMNENPDQSKTVFHFEIFTDSNIDNLQKNKQADGEKNIIHIPIASHLKTGVKQYQALTDVPQKEIIADNGQNHEIALKISANTTIKIVGDSSVDSEFIEIKVTEMTRVVPLEYLNSVIPQRTYRVKNAHVVNVSTIFDGYPFTLSGNLDFKWYCDTAGARVAEPVTGTPEPEFALFTIKAIAQNFKSRWIKKKILGDLRLKEHHIEKDCNDVFLADPHAFQFTQDLEGISIDDTYFDMMQCRKKLDKHNNTWFEVTVPFMGDNFSTKKFFFFEGFPEWILQNNIPTVTGWIQIPDRNKLSPVLFPGFSIVSETGDGSSDGFCDYNNLNATFKELLKEIDTSKDQQISAEELKKAQNDPFFRMKLSRCVCKFPSEWHADENLSKWKRLDTIIKDDEYREQILEQIKHLIFWDIVASKISSFPESPVVYHFHPLAFLQHLKKMPYDIISLKKNLRTLGFSLVGISDTFDRNTKWAIREFSCYIKMTKVAHIKENAERICKRGADFVAQMGENETANISHYVNSLEQVDNECIYNGPVIGKPVKELIDYMHFWIDNNYRCPVIVEAWNTVNKELTRTTLIKSNIWHYNDVQEGSSSKKMFVKDFTNYYDIPVSRRNESMSVLGYFFNYNQNWNGPVAINGHFWIPEGSITLESLVGTLTPTIDQESTYQIIRYIAQNECIGSFDCVNSYDRCIVSFGPCHWTLCLISNTAVDSGELGGYLSYLQNYDKRAFIKALGFFGIKADDWNGGFGNGSKLYQTQRKFTGWIKIIGDDYLWTEYPKTTDDLNYFKTWHWFYRFSFAGRTIEGYRKRMYDMTRIRIRDIITCPWPVNTNTPWPANLTVTIGDVFNSEQTIAMLTRMHVFSPATIVGNSTSKNISHLTLQKAMSSTTGLTLNWNSNPNTWQEHSPVLAQAMRDVLNEYTDSSGTCDRAVENITSWNYTNRMLHDSYNSIQFDTSGLPERPRT